MSDADPGREWLEIGFRRVAAREAMAAESGHVVTRERDPGNGSHGQRMVCTCGWSSPWASGSESTQAKRAHLHEAAIYG